MTVFLASRTGFPLCTVGKKQVPFGMARGNVELMHACFQKYSRMTTARMKYYKEREERGKRGVSMEGSKAGTKEKRSAAGLTVARAYCSMGSILPEAVGELPNDPNRHLKSIHCPLGGKI